MWPKNSHSVGMGNLLLSLSISLVLELINKNFRHYLWRALFLCNEIDNHHGKTVDQSHNLNEKKNNEKCITNFESQSSPKRMWTHLMDKRRLSSESALVPWTILAIEIPSVLLLASDTNCSSQRCCTCDHTIWHEKMVIANLRKMKRIQR